MATTMDLHLQDGNHPRRILPIDDSEWIAWGGETGAVAYQDQILHYWGDDGHDIRAVAVRGRQVALGFDSGEVLVYQYETSAKEFLTKKSSNMLVGPQLEATVRDLTFYDDSTLVVASEDGLTVWNMQTNERWLEDEAKKHHDGSGIRTLTLRDSLLVTLAMDGRWCLWDLEKRTLVHRGDVCVTRRDAGEMLGADAWDRSCRPLFLSKHSLLLPGAAWPQLRLLSPSVKIFDDPDAIGHTESIVAAASRNKFVITIGRDKRVVLWSISAKIEPKCVRVLLELESAATDIFWESDGSLRLACANGTLVVLSTIDLPKEADGEALPKKQASTQEPPGKRKTQEQQDYESKTPTTTAPTIGSDDANDKPDGKVMPSTKSSAIQRKASTAATTNTIPSGKSTDRNTTDPDDQIDFGESTTLRQNRFIDDEADDDGDDDDDVSPVDKTRARDATAINNDTSDVYDDNMDTYETDDIPIDDDLVRSPRMVEASLVEPQPAFAPSSSPFGLDRRFLCWNHIGSAISRHDDDRTMVDIHFTDAGFRRPITIKHAREFILGSLGEDGGIFCTDVNDDEDGDDNGSDEDNDIFNKFSASTRDAVKRSNKTVDPNKPTGSTVYFHRYESFASLRDKDWQIVLPSGERALGCATGVGWAAVMTSHRYLRTFTAGGNQGQIYWLQGNAVTIAGRDDLVVVIFHQGQPLQDGSQCLGYMLIDILENNIVSKGPMSCLSNKSTLTWIGLSNDKSVLAMDSNGIVSMLVKCTSNYEWMPMLDTMGLRKSRSDSFWPTTVFDGKVVCVPLKGGLTHPDAARRPITTVLGLRIPLAKALMTKAAALEELSVRANIALSQKRNNREISAGDAVDLAFEREFIAVTAQVDKVTIKTLAAYVEEGKLERALDLVKRLHLEKSFDIVMTLCDNHRNLVALVEAAKEKKFGTAYEDGDSSSSGEDEDDAVTHEPPSYNTGRQITPATNDKRSREKADDGRSVRFRINK